MQSMPYYQPGYQAPTPYGSSGAPSGATVLNASAPMMNPSNGLTPMQHALEAAAQTGGMPQAPVKRKQVKNACTNCQKACKKCDDARPCPRCIKYGIAETCVNSVRKERKKGVKRGPYKRRQKLDGDKTTAKSSNGLEGADPQSQQMQPQNGQYLRAGAMPAFGYPSNLNQYGHQTYNPYGPYTNYPKDQMLPQSYVMNPVYQSMGYPVLVPGSNEAASGQPSHAYPHSSVSQQHYGLVQNHTPQSSRPFDEHLLQQQGGSTPSMYYIQQQAPQSTLRSPHLDSKDEGFVKPQSMTPVPSASTSSGTSTPPEPAEEEESSKFARLSQLCSAALNQNSSTDATQQDGNPQS